MRPRALDRINKERDWGSGPLATSDEHRRDRGCVTVVTSVSCYYKFFDSLSFCVLCVYMAGFYTHMLCVQYTNALEAGHSGMLTFSTLSL